MAAQEKKGRFKVTAEEVIVGESNEQSSSVIPLFTKTKSYSVYRFLISRHSDKKEIRFEARYSEVRQWYTDLKTRGAISDENIGCPFPGKHLMRTFVAMGVTAPIPNDAEQKAKKEVASETSSQDSSGESNGGQSGGGGDSLSNVETLAIKRRKELCDWLEALLAAYPMLLWSKANVAFLREHRVEIKPTSEREYSIDAANMVRRHSDPPVMSSNNDDDELTKEKKEEGNTSPSSSTPPSSTPQPNSVTETTTTTASPSSLSSTPFPTPISMESSTVSHLPTPTTVHEDSDEENDEETDENAKKRTTTGTPASSGGGRAGGRSNTRESTTKKGKSSRRQREVKSQPPPVRRVKEDEFEVQREIPMMLLKYEKLFLGGWNKHPNEVLTLGEGVGEGTFGQVFKASLLIDPCTIIDAYRDEGPFTSSFVRNLVQSSQTERFSVQWLMGGSKKTPPTRSSVTGERGSIGGGSSHTGGEFGAVAVKVMRASTKRQLGLVQTEVEAMSACACPFVVSYMSCFLLPRNKSMAFSSNESIYMVMELCEAGSVSEIIQAMHKPLDEACLKAVLVSVALALAHVHSKSWLHLDIKAANIIVNNDGCAKLCDFGCAKKLSDNKQAVVTEKYGDEPAVPGTPFFFSPELCKAAMIEKSDDEKAAKKMRGSKSLRGSTNLRDSSSHGSSHGSASSTPIPLSTPLSESITEALNDKADVWALGITALQCVRGVPPFAHLHPQEAVQRILKSPTPIFPTQEKGKSSLDYSDGFCSVINKTLVLDNKERISIKDFLSCFKTEVIELNRKNGASKVLRELSRTAESAVIRLRKDTGSFSE